MGLLSGKFDAGSMLPTDDVRGSGHGWVEYFSDGRPRPEFLQKLAKIGDVLRSDGRTLVQGAIAWIWARDERTIPIPGFKNARQRRKTLERWSSVLSLPGKWTRSQRCSGIRRGFRIRPRACIRRASPGERRTPASLPMQPRPGAR
jgi:Aldo/keto reductase family